MQHSREAAKLPRRSTANIAFCKAILVRWCGTRTFTLDAERGARPARSLGPLSALGRALPRCGPFFQEAFSRATGAPWRATATVSWRLLGFTCSCPAPPFPHPLRRSSITPSGRPEKQEKNEEALARGGGARMVACLCPMSRQRSRNCPAYSGFLRPKDSGTQSNNWSSR